MRTERARGRASVESDRYLALFERLSPLMGSRCVHEISRGASELIAELLEVEACSIFLYDAPSKLLALHAATHIPRAEWSQVKLDARDGLCGRVYTDGESLLLRAKTDFARYGIETSSRYGKASCVVAPLLIQSRPRGVINIANLRSGRAFTKTDLTLINSVARLIAGAIENAERFQETVQVQGRLHEILENLHVGVVAFDGKERVTHVNQRFRELHESEGIRIRGRKLERVIDPCLYAVCRRLLRDAATAGTVQQDRVHCKLNSGERLLEVTASRVHSCETGECEGLLMFEDVGQDEEVRRLREADGLKSGFLRTISHELRTPLTVLSGIVPLIRGYCECNAKSDTNVLEKVEELVDANVGRLTDVVNTLLDVVEIDNGSLRLAPRPWDLRELVEERIEHLGHQAKRKKIDWNLQVDPAISKACVDRQRLGQSLHELLDNAIKFSLEGGTVDVGIRRENGSVAFRIANYGQPIDEKNKAEIFEKFFQGDQSTTRNASGCGLGLYLAINVARMHGGTLNVSSGRKGETVFSLKVPIGEIGPSKK